MLGPRCAGRKPAPSTSSCASTPSWPPRRIPTLSFPAPTDRCPRVSSRPANPIAEWMAHGPRPQHPVQQQLRGGQPGTARAVSRLRAQQRRARPALASRRRTAPDAVRDPRLHGIAVSVQRAVLLAAVVLPVGLRRAAVHAAVPWPARRKGLSLQRLRLFRQRIRRLRRGDGAGRARLPLGASTISSSPASTGSR